MELAHVYEVRPRKDHRDVDLISDVLPFGQLWYAEPGAVSNAVGYALHRTRSNDAVIRVYDEAGNLIKTHEHVGEFKEWRSDVFPVPKRRMIRHNFFLSTSPWEGQEIGCKMRCNYSSADGEKFIGPSPGETSHDERE
jgi:hypothetical protein